MQVTGFVNGIMVNSTDHPMGLDNDLENDHSMGLAENSGESFDPLDGILERYGDALSYGRLKIRRLKAKDLISYKNHPFKTQDPLKNLFDRIDDIASDYLDEAWDIAKESFKSKESLTRYIVIKNKSLKIFEGYIEYWLDSRTQTVHPSILAVDPSYERRGHATLLMSLAIEEALAKGCKKLTVNSTTSGVPFYVKFGCIPKKVTLDEWKRLDFKQRCEPLLTSEKAINFELSFSDEKIQHDIKGRAWRILDSYYFNNLHSCSQI